MKDYPRVELPPVAGVSLLNFPELPKRLTADEVEAVLAYANRFGSNRAISEAVINEGHARAREKAAREVGQDHGQGDAG